MHGYEIEFIYGQPFIQLNGDETYAQSDDEYSAAEVVSSFPFFSPDHQTCVLTGLFPPSDRVLHVVRCYWVALSLQLLDEVRVMQNSRFRLPHLARLHERHEAVAAPKGWL